MKYLLDTCVLSEVTKPEPSKSVVRFLHTADDAALCISVLSLGELEKGVHRLAPGRRKTSLEAWLLELRETYAGRFLDVTSDVALEWGRASAKAEAKGRPIPVVDGLIAATALVHALAVVTRNTADMARTGVRIVDPWE